MGQGEQPTAIMKNGIPRVDTLIDRTSINITMNTQTHRHFIQQKAFCIHNNECKSIVIIRFRRPVQGNACLDGDRNGTEAIYIYELMNEFPTSEG